jgi:curli biogenesis system outer membrane secretion channel CsgG
MNKSWLVVFLVATLCQPILMLQAQVAPSRPPRVAIGSFEYKGSLALQGKTDALVDMITTALVKTRKFKMVERARVDEALKEMGLGEAGVVDPNDSQKLGTLVKADLLLFGTITQASMDSREVAVAGLKTVREEMRLTLDMRIIDAKTGEIKTAEAITMTKSAAKATAVAGAVLTGSATSGIVGDMLRDVANETVRKLVANIYPVTISMVKENQVKLDVGEPMLEEGMLYDVVDRDGFKVGQVRVTEVRDKMSLGEIVSGEVAEGLTCRKAKSQAASVPVPPAKIPW